MNSDTRVDELRRMAGGFSATQILVTAAKLGIADQLASGPRSAADLAPALGAHSQALHRFLRTMVALQLLAQEGGDCFALAPLGELLRSDHPESLRDRILYIGEVNYPTAQDMLYSLQTGKPAFEHVFDMPLFEYLARRPDVSETFNRIMSADVNDRAAGVTAAYDFSSAATIVDVGGGSGTFLAAILRVSPHAKGIIFDTPAVVADAHESLNGTDLAQRVELIGGDLFRDALPSGADIYLLSRIIHDWNDERAERILRNCRAAMRAESRLLLIEDVMPENVADAPATVGSDLSMLLYTGGAERSEIQYRTLLGAAGLQLAAVYPFEPSRVYSGRRANWAILECTYERA